MSNKVEMTLVSAREADPTEARSIRELGEKIAEFCQQITPVAFHSDLIAGVNELAGDLHFRWVLSRGGWHRPGGVIDANGECVAASLEKWLEGKQQEFADDIDDFVDAYADKGYRITHLEGDSHYLAAVTGKGAAEFLQLEVEELQEVPVRPLIAPGWVPDDWQDLIEPIDVENELDSISRFEKRYAFRRLTAVTDLMERLKDKGSASADAARMLREWDASSAGKTELFCDHWVLGIRDGRSGNQHAPQVRVLNGKSVRTHCECQPEQPLLEGELARCMRDFDQLAGYPFAWYFHMLASKDVKLGCGLAVMNEHQGDYAYLPARDLQLLEGWLDSPYRA